jgi:hypothetical protein
VRAKTAQPEPDSQLAHASVNIASSVIVLKRSGLRFAAMLELDPVSDLARSGSQKASILLMRVKAA